MLLCEYRFHIVVLLAACCCGDTMTGCGFQECCAPDLTKHSMGAHRTVLTHFSQRYPHVPPIPASCRHNTVIAFDMMTVNLADLDKVPLMVECNAP